VKNSKSSDGSPTFDEAEFLALIPRMRSFARYLCRDATEAEDLTQAALARAWRRRDTYIAGSNMKAWVLTIVRNQFYSDKRRSWRVTALDPLVAEETLVALSNADAPLELEDVRRAMQELTAEQSRALNLIIVAGLPYQEAAEICGCALGTIKSRVNRARQALVALLAEGDLKASPRPPRFAMASIISAAERARGPRTHLASGSPMSLAA
jgi:RNA polymerase sigma-70 factor (ECF subfamily)